MNTYLIPWTSDSDIDIKKVVAKSLEDCEEKIMRDYCESLDELRDDNYEDFLDDLAKYGIYLGNIYELDEFM